MHARHATGAPIGDAAPSGLVPVARDQDDERVIWIPLDELRNPQVSWVSGGRWEILDRPALAGFMDPELIPPGVPFGYSGKHPARRRKDGRPPGIKVLVREDRTDLAVLSKLQERAKGAKLRRNHPMSTSGPSGEDYPRAVKRMQSSIELRVRVAAVRHRRDAAAGDERDGSHHGDAHAGDLRSGDGSARRRARAVEGARHGRGVGTSGHQRGP